MAQLNMKAVKAAYRDKHLSTNGFRTKQHERTRNVQTKVKRDGLFSRLAEFFGVTLWRTRTVAEKWMEKTVVAKPKAGGSKLGLKLYKNQVRAIARVQRKQQLGQRVSMIDVMRTGMPVRLRDLRASV